MCCSLVINLEGTLFDFSVNFFSNISMLFLKLTYLEDCSSSLFRFKCDMGITVFSCFHIEFFSCSTSVSEYCVHNIGFCFLPPTIVQSTLENVLT